MILAEHVADHESLGSTRCHLGLVRMPEGYALLLDGDGMYYYWLHESGRQSVLHWDRWAVYRGAKTDLAACEGKGEE